MDMTNSLSSLLPQGLLSDRRGLGIAAGHLAWTLTANAQGSGWRRVTVRFKASGAVWGCRSEAYWLGYQGLGCEKMPVCKREGDVACSRENALVVPWTASWSVCPHLALIVIAARRRLAPL